MSGLEDVLSGDDGSSDDGICFVWKFLSSRNNFPVVHTTTSGSTPADRTGTPATTRQRQDPHRQQTAKIHETPPPRAEHRKPAPKHPTDQLCLSHKPLPVRGSSDDAEALRISGGRSVETASGSLFPPPPCRHIPHNARPCRLLL